MALWRKIVLVICVLVLVVSCSILGFEYYEKWKEAKDLDSLAGVFGEQMDPEDTSSAPLHHSQESAGIGDYLENNKGTIPVVKPTEDERSYLQQLMDENPDCVGFLRISGTQICYPVMSTSPNNEYYLRKNFKKEYSISGIPFLDNRCDVNDSANLLIYGHHIKNGTMFQNLMLYTKKSFYEGHTRIEFFTLDEHRTYDIFAAFQSQIYTENDNVFKYYRFFDAKTKEAYDSYVRNCKVLSFYDTGITPEYGQQLITLSTCSYHVKNGRMVVVGVLRDNTEE